MQNAKGGQKLEKVPLSDKHKYFVFCVSSLDEWAELCD